MTLSAICPPLTLIRFQSCWRAESVASAAGVPGTGRPRPGLGSENVLCLVGVPEGDERRGTSSSLSVLMKGGQPQTNCY